MDLGLKVRCEFSFKKLKRFCMNPYPGVEHPEAIDPATWPPEFDPVRLSEGLRSDIVQLG